MYELIAKIVYDGMNIYRCIKKSIAVHCPKQLILINSWVLATIRTLRYIRYEPGTAA